MPDVSSLIATLSSTVTLFGKKIPIGILIVGGVVIAWLVTSKLKPKVAQDNGGSTANGTTPYVGPISTSANDVSNIQASVAQQLEQQKTQTTTDIANLRDQLTGAFNTRIDTVQANVDTQNASLRSGLAGVNTSLDSIKAIVSGPTSLLETLRNNVATLTSKLTTTQSDLATTRTGLSALDTTVTGAGGILTRLGVSESKIAGQGTEITTIKGTLTAASKRAQEAYDYADRAYLASQSIITSYAGQFNSFNQRIQSLEANTGIVQNAVSKLTDLNDPASLASVVAKASGQASAATTQVSALSTSFTSFKKIFDTLQNSVSGILSRLGLIEGDVANVKGQLDPNTQGSVGANASKVPALVAALNSNTIGSTAYNANVAYNAYQSANTNIQQIQEILRQHGWL